MTETEWLDGNNPQRMVDFLRGKASDRKLRLFAAACCQRSVTATVPNREQLWQSVEIVEQIADGLLPAPNQSDSYYYGFYTIFHGSGSSLELACHAAMSPSAWDAASGVVSALDDPFWTDDDSNCGTIYLREIVGNPFHPVALIPAWLTSTVVALAEGVYQDRAFDRMPILADALQDAGCDRDAVLAHCRDTALTHVRGCWVIDLLTGRK